MEELSRIITAWIGDLEEAWPQVPPGAITSIASLSTAIETARARVAPTKLAEIALGPLTLNERKAIAGLPTKTQWPADLSNATMVMEDEAYDADAYDEAVLRARLQELKDDTPHAPVRHCKSYAPLLREVPHFQA